MMRGGGWFEIREYEMRALRDPLLRFPRADRVSNLRTRARRLDLKCNSSVGGSLPDSFVSFRVRSFSFAPRVLCSLQNRPYSLVLAYSTMALSSRRHQILLLTVHASQHDTHRQRAEHQHTPAPAQSPQEISQRLCRLQGS